jgi:hypothetical protein
VACTLDNISGILRRAEALLFYSDDLSLKKFLELYYPFVDSRNTPGYKNLLLYADELKPEMCAISGVEFFWSKQAISEDLKARLAPGSFVEGLDLQKEYTCRFLGQCSA